MYGAARLLLLVACAHGAVVQRVTGPDDAEITHASVGGGVSVYLTGSALGTPFNPRAPRARRATS